jgi:hypothetical protein
LITIPIPANRDEQADGSEHSLADEPGLPSEHRHLGRILLAFGPQHEDRQRQPAADPQDGAGHVHPFEEGIPVRGEHTGVEEEDEREGQDREPDHGGDGVRGAPVGGCLGGMWSVHGAE